MTLPEIDSARWRKSTYSVNGSDCVELAHTNDMIRDSKNREILPLTRRAVAGLIHAAKADKL